MEKLAKGLYYNEKNPKAPDFILDGLGIKKQEFLEWLDDQEANEKGYIKLDRLMKKDGSGTYYKVNDWKPVDPANPTGVEIPPATPAMEKTINIDDIRF